MVVKARAVDHNGRVTSPKPPLSRETLEICDQQLDQLHLLLNLPPDEFERISKILVKAKREVEAALTAAGGKPLSKQRAEQQ